MSEPTPLQQADYKMSWLSEKVLEQVDDIVRDLPSDQARKLIGDWLGGDFFDFYADWLEQE